MVATATTATTTLTPQQVHPASSQNDDNSAQSSVPDNTQSRNVRPRLSSDSDEPPRASRENELSRFSAVQLLIAALFERFTAIELGQAGDCLFYVLLHLQNHDVPHANLAAAGAQVNEDVALTRARIANHLEICTAADATERLYEPTGVDISFAMISEAGNLHDYLAWIRQAGSSGGFTEVIAWVDLFKVNVKLISATMIEGALLEEPVNARGASDDAPTFHIFHQVGRDGRGGHYQLLQPMLPSRQTSCEQANAANGGNAIVDIADSPSS